MSKAPLAHLGLHVDTKRGESTHTGTILEIRRAGTSYNGNPTWRVQFRSTGQGESYQPGLILTTQLNGQVGYEISNYKEGQRVTVALTKAGRIFAIEVAQ